MTLDTCIQQARVLKRRGFPPQDADSILATMPAEHRDAAREVYNGESTWTGARYYNTEPEQMTMGQAEFHGRAHASYGWNPQPDPRWCIHLVGTYMHGYDPSGSTLLSGFTQSIETGVPGVSAEVKSHGGAVIELHIIRETPRRRVYRYPMDAWVNRSDHVAYVAKHLSICVGDPREYKARIDDLHRVTPSEHKSYDPPGFVIYSSGDRTIRAHQTGNRIHVHVTRQSNVPCVETFPITYSDWDVVRSDALKDVARHYGWDVEASR